MEDTPEQPLDSSFFGVQVKVEAEEGAEESDTLSNAEFITAQEQDDFDSNLSPEKYLLSEIFIDPELPMSHCYICDTKSYSVSQLHIRARRRSVNGLCRLFGLPEIPYGEDFKISSYCEKCTQMIAQLKLLYYQFDKLQRAIFEIRTKIESSLAKSIRGKSKRQLRKSFENDEKRRRLLETQLCGHNLELDLLEKTNTEGSNAEQKYDFKKQESFEKNGRTLRNLTSRKSCFVQERPPKVSVKAEEREEEKNTVMEDPEIFGDSAMDLNEEDEWVPSPAASFNDANSEPEWNPQPETEVKRKRGAPRGKRGRRKSKAKFTHVKKRSNPALVKAFKIQQISKRKTQSASAAKAGRSSFEDDGCSKSEQSLSDNNSDSDMDAASYASDNNETAMEDAGRKEIESILSNDAATKIPPDYIPRKLAGRPRKPFSELKRKRGIPRPCPHCDKISLSNWALTLHLASHTNKRDFICDQCGKGFKTQLALESHIETKHGELVHPCNLCDQKFSVKRRLDAHIIIAHTRVYPFICEQCGKGFMTGADMKGHVRRDHEGERYPCPYEGCGKVFKSESGYDHHVRVHEGTHKHGCKLCPFKTHSPKKLETHMNRHKGIKPEICNICQKGFAESNSLRRHMMFHNGIRPHKCSHCPKSFVTRQKKVNHEKIHSSSKPFQCRLCSKCFHDEESLQAHETNHRPVRNKEEFRQKLQNCGATGSRTSNFNFAKTEEDVGKSGGPEMNDSAAANANPAATATALAAAVPNFPAIPPTAAPPFNYQPLPTFPTHPQFPSFFH